MSIRVNQGGNMPTPAIEWITQGVTRDESYTPEYLHSMILNSQQIAALKPSGAARYGMSGHTITDIQQPQYLWPDTFRVMVTTVAQPQGYERRLFVTAQFLPWFKNVVSPAEAVTLISEARPFTAEVEGREIVTFVQSEQSALLAAPSPALPYGAGAVRRFYGVIYSETGQFLGRTSPEIPPLQVLVDRRIDKWRPGWDRVTAVWARRPSNV